MDDPLTEYCSNCKRDIPSANYLTHTTHCQRRIVLCTECGEPVPFAELNNHKQETHAKVNCSECGTELENQHLDMHQSDECMKRYVPCTYCELDLRAEELFDHEEYCGSRTESCEGCNQLVMFKHKSWHLENNHCVFKNEFDECPSSSYSEDTAVVQNEFDRNILSKKVPNDTVSSKSTRSIPSQGINRVSPLKRNNTEPQVNSSFKNTNGKQVIKPTIPRVESDHTLNEYFRHMTTNECQFPTDNEIMDSPGGSSLSEDVIVIPCEFCSSLIPADQLVLHETGCRPDLSSFHNIKSDDSSQASGNEYGRSASMTNFRWLDDNDLSNRNNDSERNANLFGNVDTSKKTNIDCLPCEFCNHQFPFDMLMTHQFVCNQRPSVIHNELHSDSHGPNNENIYGRKILNTPIAPKSPINKKRPINNIMPDTNNGNKSKNSRSTSDMNHFNGNSYNQLSRNNNRAYSWSDSESE